MSANEISKIIEKNKICWENFILECDKLGFGVLNEIKIQNGAPIYIKQSQKSIDLSRSRGKK